jgi:hypothetical protein
MFVTRAAILASERIERRRHTPLRHDELATVVTLRTIGGKLWGKTPGWRGVTRQGSPLGLAGVR